jgi:hypothetical protein
VTSFAGWLDAGMSMWPQKKSRLAGTVNGAGENTMRGGGKFRHTRCRGTTGGTVAGKRDETGRSMPLPLTLQPDGTEKRDAMLSVRGRGIYDGMKHRSKFRGHGEEWLGGSTR